MSSKFRLEHDARITNHATNVWKRVGRGVSLPADNFTYGKANRPQTPIDGIISNDFGENASYALQTRYGYLKDTKIMKSPRQELRRIRYTNAQLKADEFTRTKQGCMGMANTSGEFKLKRFMNVESKIDNKR